MHTVNETHILNDISGTVRNYYYRSVIDTWAATRSSLGPGGVTVVPLVRSITAKLGTWSSEQCDPKVEHSQRIPALQTYKKACNYRSRE